MKRRSFLKGLLGLAATPALAVMPLPAAPACVVGVDLASHGADAMAYTLFRGELGQWDGVRLRESVHADVVWRPEEIAEMEALDVAPLSINKIRPMVDYVAVVHSPHALVNSAGESIWA